MNPQIPIEARQTVLDFVTAGTSFTAYEVTIEVRRRLGTSIDVPHSIVNNIVQQMFANGEIVGYDRRADSTVQSATPPFRYYQVGGAVAAPFVAPTAAAISRSGLPPVLRDVSYDNLLVEYAFAVSEFSDEAIAITLPTRAAPTLRFRCYGAPWLPSEIERLFTLNANASANDLRWLIPLGYSNEFRVYLNDAGTQRQFLVKLDSTTQSTLTKEAERATGEPDGLEIEIAIAPHDVRALSYYHETNFQMLAVAPRVYENGDLRPIEAFRASLSGDGWSLMQSKKILAPAITMGKAVYDFPDVEALSKLSNSALFLRFGAGELELESVNQVKDSPQTQAVIEAAIARFEAEFPDAFRTKLENSSTLWDAKIIYGQTVHALGEPDYYGYGYDDEDDDSDDDNNDEPETHISRLVGGEFSWRGIAISDANFGWPASLSGVTVRRFTPTARGDKLRQKAATQIEADADAQVFIDDVNGKALARRVQMLHEATPVKVLYVLSFEDDAARANFFRETHFDTVPTRPISALALPAAPLRAVKTSNRTPFDAQLHQIKAPASDVAASFASGDGGSDDEFNQLKIWAQTAPLDENNWPDFKRLYKAIETRLWPPRGRFRYEKIEADFPATPIPDARDLELLGVLMGRLDEINASRGSSDAPSPAPPPTIAQRALSAVNNLIGRPNAATASGPSDNTLAYMKRRATKLLEFLRDNPNLSVERRDALAPIVSGLLQRAQCADINATLVVRLKLDESEVLARHPEAIARVWADATLPLPIARWSYDWLENHRRKIAVSVAQLRRFVELPDAAMTLKLAPAALQNGEDWPRDFNLKKFSDVLQGKTKNYASDAEFLARRGEIVHLFARFPQLELDKRWLRDSLREVDDEITLDWLVPWLQERAYYGEFALLETMSPALQTRFNAAIVATHPGGFSLDKWRELSDLPALVRLLSPILRTLPISAAVADFIWALPSDKRAPILSALEDNAALWPIIESHARQLDFAFIAPLSVSQWQRFARAVAASHAQGMSAENWSNIAALPFDSGYDSLPLGAGFWRFALPLQSETRALWIERVGAERAGIEFASQSAEVFERLLDSDATGLDALGNAWLDAHGGEIALDSELIIKLAQSSIADWQARALSRLSSAELRLPVALRLMESELPILENAATPFFRDQNSQWDERVLALADSPKLAARALALRLLEEFPARWTPDLLNNLAQHDDAGMQAFVAAQLQKTPRNSVELGAIEAFDHAIINARGRARRAKESVKSRVASEDDFDSETLLEAARNGAPRDREWALQQLVAASLSGKNVEGLNVEGAFAKAD